MDPDNSTVMSQVSGVLSWPRWAYGLSKLGCGGQILDRYVTRKLSCSKRKQNGWG